MQMCFENKEDCELLFRVEKLKIEFRKNSTKKEKSGKHFIKTFLIFKVFCQNIFLTHFVFINKINVIKIVKKLI